MDGLNISVDDEIWDVVVTNLLGQLVICKWVNAIEGKIVMSGLWLGSYLGIVA